MTKELIYRKLVVDDSVAMSELIDGMYKIKKKPNYFVWHNFSAPTEVVMFGAFWGRKLVGMFGLHYRMLNDGTTVGHAKSMNVHPEWVGRGVFRNLGQMAFGCFPLLDAWCVFANKYAVVPCQKAFGMKIVSPIPMMVHSTPKIFESYSSKFEQIDKKTDFSSVCSTNKGNGISFSTDDEYRIWRYSKNPLYNYFKVDGPKNTYAITKTFTDPVTSKKYGDIVDYECTPVLAKEMYLRACGQLCNTGVDQITTWAFPNIPLSNIVEELGFKKSNSITYFMIKTLTAENEYLLQPMNWQLKQSDAENY